MSAAVIRNISTPAATGEEAPVAPRRRGGLWLSALLLLALAFVASRNGWYTAEDAIGYNLGLAGGVLMLVLLLYPLRKHLPFARRWGLMKPWFNMHMALGVLGPVLVLAHTTFRVGSLNATVALVSMLLVAGSGIVGRYIYVKIHRGLHGERLVLKDLQAAAGFLANDVHSSLVYAPRVEAQLKRFEAYALDPMPLVGGRVLRFFVLFPLSVALWLRCHFALPAMLARAAAARGWDAAKRRQRTRRTQRLVHGYLKSLVRLAHFQVYERLFSWWHVLHVPLFFLLLISASVHVLAVHMY